MTDNTGGMVESSVFSSFGESIAGANPRYGYVGAFGYQAHVEFPYHHVGARYYDASTGRFLQRDPIGVFGDVNVYGYVGNTPSFYVDPSGLIGAGGGGDSHYHTGGYNGRGQYTYTPQQAKIFISATNWVDHRYTKRVQYVADWLAWLSFNPAAKIPAFWRWARWLWLGGKLL